MGLKLLFLLFQKEIKKILPIHLRDISQNQDGSSRGKKNEYNFSIRESL